MTLPKNQTYRGLSGRTLGNAKTSAKRVGLSLDEWLDRRERGEKRCFRCQEWKPIEEFAKDVSRKTGRTSSCKPCTSNASKMSIYGISKRKLDELLGSPCEICGRSDRQIDIDHCHETGVVRGGLCETCNRGLGLLGDTAESIEKALQYLKKQGN